MSFAWLRLCVITTSHDTPASSNSGAAILWNIFGPFFRPPMGLMNTRSERGRLSSKTDQFRLNGGAGRKKICYFFNPLISLYVFYYDQGGQFWSKVTKRRVLCTYKWIHFGSMSYMHGKFDNVSTRKCQQLKTINKNCMKSDKETYT